MGLSIWGSGREAGTAERAVRLRSSRGVPFFIFVGVSSTAAW